MSSLREHLSGLKTLHAMLNKHFLHLALIHVFPEDSGGNTKWLKTSAEGAQWLSGSAVPQW